MIPPHLAARVVDHQARQAERHRERSQLAANRNAGLKTRHATKLARTQQEKTMPTAADRSPQSPRDTTRTHADPPQPVTPGTSREHAHPSDQALSRSKLAPARKDAHPSEANANVRTAGSRADAHASEARDRSQAVPRESAHPSGAATGNVAVAGSRVPADASGAPPRRSGVRSGFPGRPELDLASKVLRAALANLARDIDDQARITGAQLAREASDTLLRLAERAEKASTRHKRLK